MARLIHFTLHEYLGANPELFSRVLSITAEICLSYLDSHQVKAISVSPARDLWGRPFPEGLSLNRRNSDHDLEDCDSDGQDSPQHSGRPFLEYSSHY